MMNSERLVLAAENMLEDIEVQQKLQSKIYDEKMSTSDGRRMENVDTYDVDGACGDGLPLGQPKTGCSFNKERGNLMNKDPFKEYIKQSEPNKRDKGHAQQQYFSLNI